MAEKEPGEGMGTPSSKRTLWAYGYEMVPPFHEHRMSAIRGLLDRENDQATEEARTWTARLITERLVTHVLVVSTDPALDQEANRKLEAELKALGIAFRVTLPLPVGSGPDAEQG